MSLSLKASNSMCSLESRLCTRDSSAACLCPASNKCTRLSGFSTGTSLPYQQQHARVTRSSVPAARTTLLFRVPVRW